MKPDPATIDELYENSLKAIAERNHIYEVFPMTCHTSLSYGAVDISYNENGVRIINNKSKTKVGENPIYGILDNKCDPTLMLSYSYISKFNLNYNNMNFVDAPTGDFIFNLYCNKFRNQHTIEQCAQGGLLHETVHVQKAYRVFSTDDISKVRIIHLAHDYSVYACNDILTNMANLFGAEKTDFFILLNPNEILYAPLVKASGSNYSDDGTLVLTTKKIWDERIQEKTEANMHPICCPTVRN